jgi:predicted nuclease of predicted toxin-antitoxin system
MRFKLDENFGRRTQRLFVEAGYDVHTVAQESLNGADDQTLYATCWREQRCLVTLDLDFSDVIRFPPEPTSGIVVVRVPHNPSLSLLEQLISTFLHYLLHNPIERQLIIVEAGRIRIHQRHDDHE